MEAIRKVDNKERAEQMLQMAKDRGIECTLKEPTTRTWYTLTFTYNFDQIGAWVQLIEDFKK